MACQGRVRWALYPIPSAAVRAYPPVSANTLTSQRDNIVEGTAIATNRPTPGAIQRRPIVWPRGAGPG